MFCGCAMWKRWRRIKLRPCPAVAAAALPVFLAQELQASRQEHAEKDARLAQMQGGWAAGHGGVRCGVVCWGLWGRGRGLIWLAGAR